MQVQTDFLSEAAFLNNNSDMFYIRETMFGPLPS